MRTSAFLLVLVFALASAQSEGGAGGVSKGKGKPDKEGGKPDKEGGKPDKEGKLCAFGCSTDCVWCTGLSTNDDGTRSVTIDATGCKGDAVSWFCAKGDGVALSSCRGGGGDKEASEGKTGAGKCENAVAGVFTVSGDATTVTVQLHDGNQEGDVDCSVEQCCGGGGGACGFSGVCHHVVDLSTCPGSVQPEPEPQPQPEPEPQPQPQPGCPDGTFEGCGTCFATLGEALEC